MSANDKNPALLSPLPLRRRARRCRIIAAAVLLLGLAGAGGVYWLGTRTANLPDDISMAGYYKAETRQMGMLYGKQGLLIEDLKNNLQQPGTQAILILAAAAIVAAGGFYFARMLDEEAKAAGTNDKTRGEEPDQNA